MGDAGKSVSDALGHGARIVYLNVMNRLSVDWGHSQILCKVQ